jgi:hypothetical protein
MTPQTAQKHKQAKLFLESLGITGPISLLLRALSFFETRYGTGWKVPNTHNWGAITAGKGWSGDTFSYSDPKYGEEIDSPESIQKFRKYPDDESGVRDLLRLLEKQHAKSLELARAGNWEGISEALFDSGYYGGRQATRTGNIQAHMGAFLRTINDIVEATGEKSYLVGEEKRGRVPCSGASSGSSMLVALSVLGVAIAIFASTARGKWKLPRKI